MSHKESGDKDSKQITLHLSMAATAGNMRDREITLMEASKRGITWIRIIVDLRRSDPVLGGRRFTMFANFLQQSRRFEWRKYK